MGAIALGLMLTGVAVALSVLAGLINLWVERRVRRREEHKKCWKPVVRNCPTMTDAEVIEDDGAGRVDPAKEAERKLYATQQLAEAERWLEIPTDRRGGTTETARRRWAAEEQFAAQVRNAAKIAAEDLKADNEREG